MRMPMFRNEHVPGKSLNLGLTGLALLAVLQFSPVNARASDLIIPLEIPQPNFIGLGIGAYPDYFGSDDTSFGVAPLGRVSLGRERFVSLIANDIRVNLLDSPNWRLGPEALWRFGRSDVDDDVVAKMSDIDNSADLGLFGGYAWKDPQEIRKQAGITVWGLADASSVHDGWTAGANVFGMYPVALPVTLAAGLGATYGSDNYTDTYFGVTGRDSVASGLPIFTPDGGVRDVRAWIVAMLHLSPKWHTGAGVLYSRLQGDASDSPLVDDRGSEDQWVYGVGLLYAW